MIVELDTTSTVPPYDQLREQIGSMIVAGTLATGSRLPPIRQLAKDLDLAPGTVARAYHELESLGLIDTRGRKGTFVAERPATASIPGREEQVRAAARAYAATAVQLGYTERDARAHLAEAFGAFVEARGS